MNEAVQAGLIKSEVEKRRTFAIISHPDAGKTTLTEKLLLYSGMLRTAGMVRARKGGKATSSDWMALEQERGISISASAMQFSYKDYILNVLDTPGHQDFSEDTYRTLTAADAAIMVIDAAKGVEAQTRKLFAVCRMHEIPILTFINKLDLPARDPLDLVSEVEQALGIHAAPLYWPIGSGRGFRGVVELVSGTVSLFERSEAGGALRAGMEQCSVEELRSRPGVESGELTQLSDELDLLAQAGNPFSMNEFLAGRLTPVFFGSALTNFGVEPFFDSFVKLAPPPHAYEVEKGDGSHGRLDPLRPDFAGYVFKIQTNMNPKHRDSMAYIRICSGKFERDMVVRHHRSGKEIRLSRSYSMVAQERSTTETAFPGDVVGVINPGVFTIGDTISASTEDFNFKPMPQFPPEVVAQIRPLDAMRHKQFEKGIVELSREGTVQILRPYDSPGAAPLVAAVGKLQFEVLQFRLGDEYGVKTQLDVLPYRFSAYLEGDPSVLQRPSSSFLALDSRKRVVILFTSDWEKKFTIDRNPDHRLIDFVN